MNKNIIENDVGILINQASGIIDNTYRKINTELIVMYWSIGKLINDYRKENNSKYGDGIILKFVEELSGKYGSGFNRRNINRMCLFNKKFEFILSEKQFKNYINGDKIVIGVPAPQTIKWEHYVQLFSIKDNTEIKYYLDEIANNKWSKRYLIEQKKNKAYQRLICNQKEDNILPIEKSLKDPLIFTVKKVDSEKKLENIIVDNVQDFMRELGSGYSFIGRQVKMIINNSVYRVDLVFYNKILRCFVLVDLKIGKIKRNDISQMNMYITYYNKHELDELDNKTIGIILVNDKNHGINNYLNSDENLYQVKYITKMPSIKELEDIIRENTILLLRR